MSLIRNVCSWFSFMVFRPITSTKYNNRKSSTQKGKKLNKKKSRKQNFSYFLVSKLFIHFSKAIKPLLNFKRGKNERIKVLFFVFVDIYFCEFDREILFVRLYYLIFKNKCYIRVLIRFIKSSHKLRVD